MTDTARARKPAPPCPICGRPADPMLRPFCSARCADVDLHRWLSETYVIPVEPEDEDRPGIDQPRGPGLKQAGQP